MPLTFESGIKDTKKGAGVVDLHYQSVRTAPAILDQMLFTALKEYAEVWLITGKKSHRNQFPVQPLVAA